MTTSNRRREELLVYEFHGLQPPRDEPDDSAFLGIWPEPPYYYLFFAGEPGEGLCRWVSMQQGWVVRDPYRVAYEDWQQVGRGWVEVGPFSIALGPETMSSSKTGGAEGIRLWIDPGLVFGSGMHGSTRGCLLAVADLYRRERPGRVVDMGTGTGILAVSCGMLGATRVVAVDRNPLAVRTAAKNVRRNRLQGRVTLLVAEDLGILRGSSDLLIMNLELPILKQLLAREEWLAYPKVILSGFFENQWHELQEYIPSAYYLRGRKTIDGWMTMTLARDA